MTGSPAFAGDDGRKMNQLFPSPSAGRFGLRRRRARGARIPVTIVTGFLGAGKTTLIRHFLTTPEGRGTALVVNEFGATAIDDALLRDSADATALIGNGCLCCVMRSDLQITLRGLVTDRERGAIPDFARVVIETSGLADPSPILQTFATDRALGGSFHVESLIAVVDAAAGEATLDWSAEARKQIILADRLIVTKADLAGENNATALMARLGALNPRAAIARAVNGALDPQYIVLSSPTEHSEFVAEADHSDGIASFVLRETSPLSWAAFARAMEMLTALRGPDLLRVKGFLDVEGCRGPVLVQFVQHLAHLPVELDRWPDGDHGSRLVFITRNMPERKIRALFSAVRALA
jgi:G3E family GTPase